VVLAAVDLAAAEVARETLAARGSRALTQRTDVSDAKDVTALVARTLEKLGRLDVLVSNAGIGGTHAFLDEPLEHWNRVLAVNLTGVFLCGQAAARMIARDVTARSDG